MQVTDARRTGVQTWEHLVCLVHRTNCRQCTRGIFQGLSKETTIVALTSSDDCLPCMASCSSLATTLCSQLFLPTICTTSNRWRPVPKLPAGIQNIVSIGVKCFLKQAPYLSEFSCDVLRN
eukprot:1175572-Prorocentrum_minimum.AAC.6